MLESSAAKGKEEVHIELLMYGPVRLLCFPCRTEKWPVFWMDQDVFEGICKVHLSTGHSIVCCEVDCIIKWGIVAAESLRYKLTWLNDDKNSWYFIYVFIMCFCNTVYLNLIFQYKHDACTQTHSCRIFTCHWSFTGVMPLLGWLYTSTCIYTIFSVQMYVCIYVQFIHFIITSSF